ncbi:double-strand break repair helicase AddA [Meridianimarinicoccus aquatilis]|uniref:DNA 3'-5' helicase n=1 Tax=Meridianimarinicoccus aquatilis TaxID=2552766 RepID=A0A4R6AZM4_9RHOB|nr:double-strand break repair helicase AddA [Fluviibacterium aquatile]TDL89295.1 double-strand break repair helicase AddA [Fluviibacterium aquatile]
MTALNDATRRQIDAANPDRSTWLGANAGSGKTRVLTDRVARLLLSGTPPQNILCLTYTKAAASEMQNRLFRRLGEWAMKPDAELRDALTELGLAGTLDDHALNGARRLFAQAIETPGGLKIQTIHAFCAALLRQFPLEAGVSPSFTELDERSAAVLAQDVLEEMSDGQQGALLDGLAHYLTGDDKLSGLLSEMLKARAAFATPRTLPDLLTAHGLPADFCADTLLADVFDGSETDMFTTMLPILRAKGGNDGKAAEKIAPLLDNLDSLAGLAVLEGVLLSGKDTKAGSYVAKTGSFPTKPTRTKLGEALTDALDALMERVEAARDRRLALASAHRSAALHAFAAVFLPAIEAQKTARGLLDFDDLILRTRELLSQRAAADWVLYKLDGRIDHILVDEAQDTSPEQWDVIRLLAQELTSGAGARDGVNRTIFVVGDKKQSIYSFQGADPAAFDRLRGHFETALAQSGEQLQDTTLTHSFRSSAAVLDVVDQTFAAPEHGAAVGGTPVHVAFKDTLPGRVDLWNWVEKEDDTCEEVEWFAPVDRISPRAPDAVLATKIAAELRRLIDAGETVPDGKGNRVPLHEGHVLILVRRRGPLFRAIIRACKAHGLDIAGADRLKLTRDMAVRDLMALLSYLALPEDDLSLACALRSPLLGWSEDALYRLAQPRPGYLWQALRATAPDSDAYQMLMDLGQRADFLRPFDLLERVLIRHRGREKLVARLGPDCEEAIDALLGEALNYERANIPSLTGFLEWMRGDSVEVKRQAESAGRRLRVMTVHGAKGLEAPLVILPECGKRNAPTPPGILLDTDSGVPFWTPTTPNMPEALAPLRADSVARQEEERLRLLYVAMTRAESWLWICASGEPDKTGTSWHAMAEAGLSALGARHIDTPTGPGLRYEHGNWAGLPEQAEDERTTAPVTLPEWVVSPSRPRPPIEQTTITASGLGGAKALPGDSGVSEEAAKLRGTRLHLLLERLPDLPEASWPALAPEILDLPADEAAEIDDLLAEATGVLTAPSLRPLFAADALAEVGLTCPLPGLLPPPYDHLVGIVDRLLISDDGVLAIDYKSNTRIPDIPENVPEGLLRQMGAYCVALEAIYPGVPVQTALLWTRSTKLMYLPRDLVIQALQYAASSPANLDG